MFQQERIRERVFPARTFGRFWSLWGAVLLLLLLLLPLSSNAARIQIFSITPKVIGFGGGLPLTIYGNGFPSSPADMTADFAVKINEKKCEIIAIESTSLVCRSVPPMSDLFLEPNWASAMPLQKDPEKWEFEAAVTIAHMLDQVSATLLYSWKITPSLSDVTHATTADGPLLFNGVFHTADPLFTSIQLNSSSDGMPRRATCSTVLTSTFIREDMYRQCILLPSESAKYNASVVERGGAAGGAAIASSAASRDVFRLADDGTPYTTDVFPVLTSVQPKAISPGGGVRLTINGVGFSTTPNENVVTLGEQTQCSVISASSTQLECKTAAGTPIPSPIGNTGLEHRVFFGSFLSLADLNNNAKYLQDAPDVRLAALSELDLKKDSAFVNPYAVSLRGIFVPPRTAYVRFYCTGSDFVELKLGANEIAEPSILMCQQSGSLARRGPLQFYHAQDTAVTISPMLLEAGRYYTIEVKYGISSANSFYSVGMSMNAPTENSRSTFASIPYTVIITPAISNSSLQQYAPFQLQFNDKVIGLPAVVEGALCSTVSIASRLRSFSLSDIGLSESILSDPCRWILQFSDASVAAKLTVSGATLRTIIGEARSDWYYETIPPRMFRVSTSLNATIPIRVRVRKLTAYSASLSPFSVTANEPAPQVLSASPMSVTVGTRFALTGKNFDSTTTPIVYFGSILRQCTNVQVVSSEWLGCTVPTLPAGLHRVTSIFGSRGEDLTATFYVQAMYSFQSVSPRLVCVNGGVDLTFSGTNLPAASSKLTITIAGKECVIVMLTTSTVKCRVQAMPDFSSVVAAGNRNHSAYPTSYDQTSATFIVNASLYQEHPTTGAIVRLPPSSSDLFVRFSWANTPTVVSVSPSFGASAEPQLLEIAGSNLAGTTVELCKGTACVACFVVNQTSTRILCNLSWVSPGNYSVVAFLSGFGRSNSNLTYTAALGVRGIFPSVGSPWGGALVTIHGEGFTPSVGARMGSIECTTKTVNWTHIVCAAGAPNQIMKLPVEVAVFDGPVGICLSEPCEFSFNSTILSPIVSAVQPRVGQAVRLTLTGQRFPSTPESIKVSVGSTPCDIELYLPSDQLDEVLFYCTMKTVSAAGSVKISVEVQPYGKILPLQTDLFEFLFPLVITSVTPQESSIAGGRLITITGIGFASDADFKLADHKCSIITVNATYAVCQASALSSLKETSGHAQVALRGLHDDCCKFVYSLARTIILNQIFPLTGVEGSIVNVSGTFSSVSAIKNITIIGVPVKNLTSTGVGQLSCIIPRLPAFKAPPRIETEFGHAWSLQGYSLMALPVVESIEPSISSAGGWRLVTITGYRYTSDPRDNLAVTLCGRKCEIISSSFTQIVCRTPVRVTSDTLSKYPSYVVDNLQWLPLVPDSPTQTQAAFAVDGDTATSAVLSPGERLVIAVEGDLSYAFLEEVQLFPTVGMEQNLLGTTIQLSVSGESWTTVGAIMTPQVGWNQLLFPVATTNARFLQLTPPNGATQLTIAEIRIRGILGTVSTGSDCLVVVSLRAPTSDYISTCTSQPMLCATGAGVSAHYYASFTPIVNSLRPQSGSVLGGTAVSIYGSGFGLAGPKITVTLDGVPCHGANITEPDRLIMCVSAAKTLQSPPVTEVYIEGRGRAVVASAPFVYGDPWSSTLAWLGGEFPTALSIVTIPVGVAVLLDVSPPDLTALIVEGTVQVIGDDVELRATYIIVDGGKIIAGSPVNAYLGKFTITLLGDKLSPQMPIYGSSVLGVYNGKIELYGTKRVIRSRLAVTALAGTTDITIRDTVSWKAGEQVIITSTSGDYTQTEIKTLVYALPIGGSRSELRFTTLLKHTHLGGEMLYDGGVQVDVSASVAILSRSIVIQGSSDGFDRGHGGHVLILAGGSGTSSLNLVSVEFRNMGQRGLALRHPLSIVVPRAMIDSRVSDSTIHHSVNRGIFLDGASYFSFSGNTIFNVYGHGVMASSGRSLYLGITGNLVAMTLPSDLDPRASNFYFTHPFIDVSKNVAAGASYAGFWYDLAVAADAGTLRCPDRGKMGTMQENIAFGNGHHGLAVSPRHYPQPTECLPSEYSLSEAVVKDFTAYKNNYHGMYFESVGGYLITGAKLIGNKVSGIAIDRIARGGVTITSSYFAAKSPTPTQFVLGSNSSIIAAIRTPASNGLVATGNIFSGYSGTYTDQTTGLIASYYVVVTCGSCSQTELGGFSHRFTGSMIRNSNNLVFLAAPATDRIIDIDGSLVGVRGASVTAVAQFSHLAGLPPCAVAGDATSLRTDRASLPVMLCNSSLSFHSIYVFSVAPSALLHTTLITESTLGVQAWHSGTVANRPYVSGYLIILPSGFFVEKEVQRNVTWFNFTTYLSGTVDMASWSVRLDSDPPLQNPPLMLRFQYTGLYVGFEVFEREEKISQNLQDVEILPLASLAAALPTLVAPLDRALQDTRTVTTTWLDRTLNLLILRIQQRDNRPCEMFSVNPVPCSASGCILQHSAVETVSYMWQDLRAWGGEKLPQEGEDVVIPYGMTVTLNIITPKLRSLIVQGTLIFHPRLDVILSATYVVVFGGSIEAGSIEQEHAPLLTINLLNDDSVPPLQINEDIVLQPGTFAVFGHISFVGVSKETQWSTLNDRVGPDDTSPVVKTGDSVDWSIGDVAAISSSSYRMDEIDEVIVGEANSDSRGFARASLAPKFEHLSRLKTIAGRFSLEEAAKVAVLTRRVLIRGMNSTGQPEGGCSVLFDEIGSASTFAAHGVFMNVEVARCGWKNSSGGAVTINNVRRAPLVLAQNAVHHSLSSAIVLNGSTKVQLTNNVLYHSIGSTLVMGHSNGCEVSKNIAFGTFFPDWMKEGTNRSIPYALCTYDSRFGVNIFRENVAAGSESEGFCIQLGDCNEDSALPSIYNNEAHSNVIGFFAAHSTNPSQKCGGMFGTFAWRNSYAGIHSAINIDTQLTSVKTGDNHIGVFVSKEGSGNVTLLNPIFAGRTSGLDTYACSYFRCATNVFDRSCNERYGAQLEERSFTEGEIGLMMSSFLSKTTKADYSRDDAALPIQKPAPYARPASRGSVHVLNPVFDSFLFGRDVGKCSGSTAVVVNSFSLQTVVPYFISNVSWTASSENGRVYFYSPLALWATHAMCDTNLCDSLNHVLLHDVDGTFLQIGHPSAIVSNYAPAALGGCTRSIESNVFVCTNRSYGELQVTNLDADALERSFEPLEIQDQDHLAQINMNSQPPDCNFECSTRSYSRTGSITTVLKLSRTYLIDFGAEEPRTTMWKLRNCPPDGPRQAIIVRVSLPSGMDFSVWDGVSDAPVVQATSSLTYTDSPGQNYFEATDSRLYVLLQCETDVEIHQIVAAVVSLRIEMSIEQYVMNHREFFIPLLAKFLSISSDRLRIVDVFPGSTIITFKILGVDSRTYNSTEEANNVNHYVMFILSSSFEDISAALGVPVVDIEHVVWAQGTPTRKGPDSINIPMSSDMKWAISVSSIIVALTSIIVLKRVRKSFLVFREEFKDDQLADLATDHSVAYQMGIGGVDVGNDDEAVQPTVDVRLHRFRIALNDGDDGEGGGSNAVATEAVHVAPKRSSDPDAPVDEGSFLHPNPRRSGPRIAFGVDDPLEGY